MEGNPPSCLGQMPEGIQVEQTLPTLSVGNIVTVGLKLFSKRGGAYFVTSLLAHLWMLLGWGGVILVSVIAAAIAFVTTGNDWTSSLSVAAMTVLFTLPLSTFVWGRFVASGSLITRTSFKNLTQIEETPEAARQQIYPRLWTFFWGSAYWILVSIGVYLVLGAVLYVLGLSLIPLIDVVILEAARFEQGPFVVTSLIIVALLVLLALGLLVYYITARLWFFDAVLALEEQVTPIESIQRSWQLTRHQGWNVMIVLFIGSVATAPLAVMASFVNYFVPFFSLVVGCLLFAFWQTVKAVHYYELRNRNEGFSFDFAIPTVRPRQLLRRVAIHTPESIELDFALGGLGSRAYAWIIDQTLLWLAIFCLWYLGSAIYFYVVLPSVSDTWGTEAMESLGLWTLAIASFLTYLLSNGYYIAFETFWQGQTPGKRLAKIRVIQDQGQPVGLREASLRSLIGPIDFSFLFIGVFLITFQTSEKRLGDLAAGTLVIQDEQRQSYQQSSVRLRFGQRTRDAAQQLIQEANLQAITADQYLMLRDFLGYRSQLDPQLRKQITVKLATQLQEIIAPQEPITTFNVFEEELLEATYVACWQTIYRQT